MSNPYQPQDPNNPYGSQPEQGYNQPYGQPQGGPPTQPPYDPFAGQTVPPPQYGQQPIAYGGQPGYYTPVAPIRQRPVGVSIIAVLNWIGSGLLLLAGLLLLIAGSAFGLFDAGLSGIDSLGAGFVIAIMVIILVFAGLGIWIGIGLWRMQSWAHIISIVLYGLNIVIGVFGLGSRNGNNSGLCTLVLSIVVVVYLLLPNTRAAFRR